MHNSPRRPAVSVRGRAFIAGAFEHPARRLAERSAAEIFSDVATGALADAGLGRADIDGVFCDSTLGGLSALSVAEHLGINARYLDSTDIGGSAYLSHVGHAAAAIASGKCHAALVMLAGKTAPPRPATGLPEQVFEDTYGPTTVAESPAQDGLLRGNGRRRCRGRGQS